MLLNIDHIPAEFLEDTVRKLVAFPKTMELMAVIAFGHPAGKDGKAERRPVEDVISKEL